MAKLPVESRAFAQIKEVRFDEEKNQTIVQGYATTYNSSYPVYGGPEAGGWNETIARGASKKSLSENADVRFLINHDGLPLARTASGTLNLEDDELGLFSEANLDMSNPKAQEVKSVLSRGDADQMSFAFRVVRQEWNEDRTERTIKEVELLDVSLVTYPANPSTQIGLRDQILADAESRVSKAPVSTPNLDKIREILASVKA
jgi:HK97 family phage prohead protease